MSEQQQQNKQLNIELTDDVAQGIYSNVAIITHSTSEFVLDFARVMPGVPKAGVKSRIILTTEHAKRLLFALQDNISKYEASFGKINLADGPAGRFPMGGFGTPTAKA